MFAHCCARCYCCCCCEVMSYCLTSCLLDGMESYMRSVAGQLDSPSADFTLQSTQVHAQCVKQFEGHSAILPPWSSAAQRGAHTCASHPTAASLRVRVAVLAVIASLEQYLSSEGSSVSSFVSLCESLVDAGDEGMALFLSLLATMTDFEAWVSMARDEAKRRYVRQVIAGYAAMAAQQQQH